LPQCTVHCAWVAILLSFLFEKKCKKCAYSCITNVALVGTKAKFHCDFATHIGAKKT